MARFKKFFQRIPHGSYDELLVGELQSDSRVKDPEVKLRVDYVAKKSNTGFQREESLIITKWSALSHLVEAMQVHRYFKNIEKGEKKVAKSRTITRTKEAGTEKSL